MKKVIIYKTIIPEMNLIPFVEVVFNTGTVVLSGDKSTIENMESFGVLDKISGRTFFPKDGVMFLEKLKFAIDSPYLNASDIVG